MQFRLTYTASGRDVDLRRSWRGRRRAHRVADALLDAGFIARAKPDDTAPRMLVQAADRGENVRLVAFVAADGAMVTGELGNPDMPQAGWACLMRVLTVIETSTAWRSSSRSGFDERAAEFSVQPDGSVGREAVLSESALEAAVGELLGGLGPADERPRPGVDEVLAAASSEAAEAVPPGEPFAVTWAAGLDGDFGAGWLEQGTDRSVLGALQPVAETTLGRLRDLGSEATGWPSGIRVARNDPGAEASVGTSAYIDRIPVYPDGRPFEAWGGHVVAMTRRTPAYRPAWLGRAVELMRQTGRRLPDL